FYTKPDQRKYGNKSIILYESDCIQFDSSVKGSMQADNYFIACVKDIIKVAKAKHKKYKQNSALTLYEKYSKKDICRLFNWDTDEKGTIFGYRTKYNTCPIFITYHKSEVEESVD